MIGAVDPKKLQYDLKPTYPEAFKRLEELTAKIRAAQAERASTMPIYNHFRMPQLPALEVDLTKLVIEFGLNNIEAALKALAVGRDDAVRHLTFVMQAPQIPEPVTPNWRFTGGPPLKYKFKLPSCKLASRR